MSTAHTVVLVDDHPAFRLGVRQVIASDDPALGHGGVYGGDCFVARLSAGGQCAK